MKIKHFDKIKKIKPKHALIGVSGLIVIVVILVLIFKKRKVSAQNSATNLEKTNIQMDADFPLKKGSNGIQVSRLQKTLNSVYDANLVVDGAFGENTQKAVERYLLVTEIDITLYNQIIPLF